MNVYEELANAIIIRAAADYKAALKILKKNPHSIKGQRDCRDCEMFFRSEWFKALTTVSGEMLLKKLREEAA